MHKYSSTFVKKKIIIFLKLINIGLCIEQNIPKNINPPANDINMPFAKNVFCFSLPILLHSRTPGSNPNKRAPDFSEALLNSHFSITVKPKLHSHLLCNFLSKIFFLLLKSLSCFKTNESLHRKFCAVFFRNLGDILCHCLLTVFGFHICLL